MTARLVILTGAPESHRLDWTTSGLLLTSFQPSIARFAQLQPSSPPQAPLSTDARGDTSRLDLAVWRTLPLVRAHISTGFSQQHDLLLVGAFPTSADFLHTVSIFLDANSQSGASSQGENDQGLLAEFYEHSFAAHEDVANSQLLAASSGSQPLRGSQSEIGQGVDTSDASFVSDTNSNARSLLSEDGSTTLLEGDTSAINTTVSAPKTPLRPGWAGGRGAEHLSDLEDIPSAGYLLRVAPQTVTVTLVAGIISIAAPRPVGARQGSRAATRTLVEVLLGDETKSGFAVTFWIPAGDDMSGMAGTLAGLRSQDIVLVQNVALNVFRGKVYGGSLGRGMTRVHLLYRAMVDDRDVGGHYSHADLISAGRAVQTGRHHVHPQLEKTRRVRDWVLKFVGGDDRRRDVNDIGGKASKKRRRAQRDGSVSPRRWNQPPPLESQ